MGRRFDDPLVKKDKDIVPFKYPKLIMEMHGEAHSEKYSPSQISAFIPKK